MRASGRLRVSSRSPWPTPRAHPKRRMPVTKRAATLASACALAAIDGLGQLPAGTAGVDALTRLAIFVDEQSEIFVERVAQELMTRDVFFHSDENKGFIINRGD